MVEEQAADTKRRWYHGRLSKLAAAVALLAIVVYLPAVTNDFTNWDDLGYVVENAHLSPLDGHFLAWAFTTFQQANWHPLTWLSLGVDHALFGLVPFGYHLFNVLLHGLTTLLVVLLVGRLFAKALEASDERGLVGAVVVGLLFAAHPLHVESVAWVSERKDLLCGFFYVLALLLYLRFTELRSRGQYVATLSVFALALLAKPMAVSLPLVLLTLDAYPLTRFTKIRWKKVLLEKVPFMALGVASSVVTLVAQSRGGAVATIRHLGLGQRLWIAERALGFYLAKMALPINLVPIYPLEAEISPWRWDYVLSLVLILAVTGAAVTLRRRQPLAGALCAAFLVMLLPVIGLVQVGQQAAADRYMYLPMLAPAIGIGALVIRFWRGGGNTRAASIVTLLVAMAGLCVLTVLQIGVWRDPPALWAWVIQKQPKVAIAHYNLGEYLRGKGDMDGAAQSWERASKLEPSFSWPLNQLGNLAVLRGEFDQARDYYERATRVNANDAEAQLNYAEFLEDQADFQKAREHYESFLRVAPGSALAHLIPEVREKLSLPPRP